MRGEDSRAVVSKILNEILVIGFQKNYNLKLIVKLREREGQRVDLGRSLKGHL